MIKRLQYLSAILVVSLFAVASASSQIVIEYDMEVTDQAWWDVDVNVTVDDDGTIDADSLPDLIDPIQIPDWMVADGMASVYRNFGDVTTSEAFINIFGFMLWDIVGGWLEVLEELFDELVEALDGVADAWKSMLEQ